MVAYEDTMIKRINEIKVFFKGINRSVVAMLMLTLAFTGCDYSSSWSPYQSKATLTSTVLTYQATTIAGTTTGDPSFKWSLQVVKGSDFCSATSTWGYVKEPFYLKFTENEGETERTAIAQITFSDGYSKTFTIRQIPKTGNPEYDRAWAEQPEYKPGSALVYKTHYTTTHSGREVRNYSFCYDTEKLVSHWVAYPVHKM